MTASPAKKAPLLLILGPTLALAFLHFLLSSPWDLLFDAPRTALGTWAFGPCALAALAVMKGEVEPTTARTSGVPLYLLAPLAALLPLVAVAILAGLHEPMFIRPFNWTERLLPIAAAVGAGLATGTLFWQGTMQKKIEALFSAPVRVALVVAAGAIAWLPFWLLTTGSIDGFALWRNLVLLLLVPALLFEAGLKLWLVTLLSFISGFLAIYAYHAPFLVG